ncbi:EAL domain-containing protein [Vibrio sp. CAU 1672]|uniref:putative bifunctional diguanylate cyclase/phosphodiesterase n=1 Tax=Vibrio sp. CAU 1672 TaxID=3032594 RepID=UPI0023DA050A|nr:EAL domain-containing protein [Vibrio sp. CAU 1672]MDF2152639.1 EAL domain-containing protein [Vibrio sp. CAU 1672]
MIEFIKKISSKQIITICTILVSVYLATIIGITSLGQNKLKESQYRELELKVNSYASTLDNIFTIASEDVEYLSIDRTVQTFFANLASGMSIEYGLGASLVNLKRQLDEKVKNKTISNTPLFKKLTLVGNDGEVILSTDKGDVRPHEIDELINTVKDEHNVRAFSENGVFSVQLVKRVDFSGDRVAFLIADINKRVVIEQLTNQEYEESYSRMVLMVNDIDFMVWDTISNSAGNNDNHALSDDLSRKIFFEVPVAQHNLVLKAWFEPLGERDIFTSKTFISWLSLLAIVIVIGLCYAFLLNNNRVELKIKLEEEKKRQDILALKNQHLTQEIERRKASETELAHQAKHDTLTGLPNRVYGPERLDQELARAERNGSNVLVMFIDLDHFKQINDSMGHFIGDEILKLSAERLQHTVRRSDILARIGGDEFLLVIPDLKGMDNAEHFASTVLSAFSEPLVWNNHEFFQSISIGMSVYPNDGKTAEQLLACADMAMYRVKQDGRNAFCFFNQDMNYNLQYFLDLESRLRNAISNNLLQLYYQPIIHLQSGQVVGAEALMRWDDDKYGFVNPEEFIAVAEKNGLIHQLGEFAIAEACQQVAQWQSITPLFVSVNFSSVQFRYCERVFQQIERSLRESGLPADKFDIEVTESLLLDHSDELDEMLGKLRQLGTKLTLDDFGTGYSALGYIQKFPFDRLKIDRGFMQDIFDNDSNRELVNVIVAMAKALKLDIVAEGIEDRRHVDFLNALDCEYGQGFYFSRPLPAAEFEALLHEPTRV